ncbi:hypothetical protein Lpp77_01647 [Lacticaseibacillus paracasei subsp. paracasei CNCM I-4270]|uniref:Uncharacterized protein n=1 Tax=Lacticaseibacillus paracasei subsp. paracasei CNCM I-4270 TaxID=1256202 RepID=A0A8E0MCT8_LACPA|nr:hypothetical protein Lpp77_01647 [Lacticaseibacillus paracasei subsp. paracasei CNCM I-4270]
MIKLWQGVANGLAEIVRWVRFPHATLSPILKWVRTANSCIISVVFDGDIGYYFCEVIKMFSYSDLSQLFKDGSALAKKIKSQELNQVLLSYQSQMMNMNAEIADLRQKLAAYESQKNLSEKVVLEEGIIKIDNSKQRYCPRCWGKDRKLNPVSISLTDGQVVSWCPTCGSHTFLESEDAESLINKIKK